MPRRGGVRPKDVQPDPIYKSTVITKLINRAMRDGKRTVAEKQVYGAMEVIKQKEGTDPIEIFNLAIENIKPTTEVRPRRIGGAAYQVPMSVRGQRRESLAIRWLIAAARARSNSEYHTFADKLAAELIDAAKQEGGAYKKKIEVERIAEANKAFAHFRW